MSTRTLSLLCAAVAAVCVAGRETARAQCPAWSPAFHFNALPAAPAALVEFDDGTGPALYAGGSFQSAGAAAVNRIARWNGVEWTPLGSGVDSTVRALVVFDDGAGPALYAGGDFAHAGGVPAQHIAKWNGSTWTPLGSGLNASVGALCVFDDGSGPALYAGGSFTNAGGSGASFIARWNGFAWSALGASPNADVAALAVFDDGAGPALYVGGSFTMVGGAPVHRLARWDGTVWTLVGPPGADGTNSTVSALAVYDDGSGAALYVGGFFDSAGAIPANRIARWGALAWTALGTGLTGGSLQYVKSMTTYDDGSGLRLVVTGTFTSAGGTNANDLAAWDGAQWSAFGSGPTVLTTACATFDDGTGMALYVGSYGFETSGGAPIDGIARWNGSSWSTVGPAGQPLNAPVKTSAVADDGAGPALFVAGYFTLAGGVDARHIARWDGTSWSALSSVPDQQPMALIAFDDGTGPALVAGGKFIIAGSVPVNHVAQWNGSTWSALGAGLGGVGDYVEAFAVYDDGSGPALYAGGSFLTPAGANFIAKWDGANWIPLGSGMDRPVYALTVFDDGSGAALYAGGTFTTAGGIAASSIARWNGTSWSALGSGLTAASVPSVIALATFDDGSGPMLYAGGFFAMAGGAPASNIARWSGASWSALTSGVNDGVTALAVFDDGSGPALHVGGYFAQAGGLAAAYLARWSGSSWIPFSSGMNGSVQTLCVLDTGSGPALFAGGYLGTAGGFGSAYVAALKGCDHLGARVCAGDGSAGPCPCANSGVAQHGCDNSAATGGAILDATGWTSLAHDSLVLTSSGELSSVLSIFLQGDHVIAPANFGDGLRCAGGSLRRLYVKNAIGGTVAAPQPGDLSVSARSAALGDAILSGEMRVYQVYYRDPDLAFCAAPTGNSWNVSSGLRIGWLP